VRERGGGGGVTGRDSDRHTDRLPARESARAREGGGGKLCKVFGKVFFVKSGLDAGVVSGPGWGHDPQEGR